MDLLKCVLTWSLVYFLPTLPLSLHLRPAQLEVLNPIHSLLLIFLVAIHFRIKLLITLSYVRAALDFTPDPQTVVFPVGSSVGERRCIDIPLNDDVLVEVPESFSVIAASTDPNIEFSAGGNVATVTITDNDSKKLADWYSIIMTIINHFFLFLTVAQFRYSQPTYVVGESNGPALPAIELVFGTLTFDIDVDVATVPGGSATGMYNNSSCSMIIP